MASDFVDDEGVMADENDFDVIIVGAGLTGLACAYNILTRRAGLEILIIEANDEIGGRLLPQDYSETFHANFLQKNIIDLLHDLHLDIQPRQSIDGKKRIIYTKKGPIDRLPAYSMAEIDSFLRVLHRISLDPGFEDYKGHEEAEELAELSVEQLLRRTVYSPFGRSVCRAFAGSACANRNLEAVSTLWFLGMLNGAGGFLNRLKVILGDDERFFVQGGMKRIARKLLGEILLRNGVIRYAESVGKIRFNDDRAYVFTDQNCFKCDVVLIAVAPLELKNIDIEPQLPSHFPTAAHFCASTENAFFNIAYEEPFWRDCYTGDILATPDSSGSLSLVYDAALGNFPKKYLLAGFLDYSNSEQTAERGLFDTIAECFNSVRAEEYLMYKKHEFGRNDISSEELIGATGPMAVPKPSCISNYVNFTDPPNERILFAASEYAREWPGTVDGAIEAGQFAAYSILGKMRPQALRFRDIIRMKWPSRGKRRSVPFNFFLIQCIGLTLNIAILISYLRAAYKNMRLLA